MTVRMNDAMDVREYGPILILSDAYELELMGRKVSEVPMDEKNGADGFQCKENSVVNATAPFPVLHASVCAKGCSCRTIYEKQRYRYAAKFQCAYKPCGDRRTAECEVGIRRKSEKDGVSQEYGTAYDVVPMGMDAFLAALCIG